MFNLLPEQARHKLKNTEGRFVATLRKKGDCYKDMLQWCENNQETDVRKVAGID
jgi:hypothetical protein